MVVRSSSVSCPTMAGKEAAAVAKSIVISSGIIVADVTQCLGIGRCCGFAALCGNTFHLMSGVVAGGDFTGDVSIVG